MKTKESIQRNNSFRAFLAKTKSFLKRFPLLIRLKRLLLKPVALTKLNIVSSFPLYAPNSSGAYNDRAALTTQTINQLFPFLKQLSQTLKHPPIELMSIESFPQTEEDVQSAQKLKTLFDKYGSDKANKHNYHLLLGAILKNTDTVKAVFEIGLGTNNPDVVSNMGDEGRPGASLRAFRDFFGAATIYGADVDKRILFKENRIETFFVDQTDPRSFEVLKAVLPDEIDLIIDDGLHSPNANIAALDFALSKIKAGGWIVIEDISVDARVFWEFVAVLFPGNYKCYLFQARPDLLFAIQRLS